jgi:hypothetical protein
MSLQEKVEALFSKSYLFDPARTGWRDRVCPIGTDETPTLPLSTLLGFIEVSTACNDNLNTLAEALAHSKVVEVAKSPEGKGYTIRRREPLAADEDPERRTVAVKPIHFSATTDLVKQFFSSFGQVVAIDRRTFIDRGVVKPKPTVLVTFATVEAAEKCIQHPPSHGTVAGDALANLWIPKLTVTRKRDYDNQLAQEAEREFEQQHRNANVQQGGAAAEGSDEVTKFLTKGCTCRASGLAEGMKWENLKSLIGGICPPKSIEVVRLAGNGVGYVVFKNGKLATEAAMNYQNPLPFLRSVTPNPDDEKLTKQGEKLRSIVPHFALLSGEEEERVIRDYPSWVGNKVQKKREHNFGGKRPREE